jgi:hypothetical protein
VIVGHLCPRSYDPGQRDPENSDPNVVREKHEVEGADQGRLSAKQVGPEWIRSEHVTVIRWSTWTKVDQINNKAEPSSS